MAFTETYLNYDLGSGGNDGTTEADAWRTWGDAISGASAGDRVNVKRTSSRIDTGEISWTVSGTATAPIHIRAYTSSVGDGGMFEMDDRFKCSGENVLTEGLDISSNTTLLLWQTGDMSASYRCKVVTTSSGGAIAKAADGVFINCSFTAPISSSYIVLVTQGSLLGCYIEVSSGAVSSGGRAVQVYSGYKKNSVVNCIIKGNGDADLIGIKMDDDHNREGGLILNNTIENCGIGLQMPDGANTSKTDMIIIQDNIIYNGVRGMENLQATNTTTVGHILNNNATGSLSGAAYTNMGDLNLNAVTLTASPFVDTTDYQLNNISGGGALLKKRGDLKSQRDPSVLSATSASRTTFPDIGANTRANPETSHVF